jgi:hypothetical protein
MSSLALSSSLLADDSPSFLHSAFKSHCIKCHGQGKDVEGEANLVALKTCDDFQSRPALLEDMIAALKDRDLLLVVAGGGGGNLNLGKHFHCKTSTPLANRWLTQLQVVGINRDKYADSTRTIPEILA